MYLVYHKTNYEISWLFFLFLIDFLSQKQQMTVKFSQNNVKNCIFVDIYKI